MNNWQPIDTAPADEKVWTKIDDKNGERNVQELTRKGRLWFTSTADGLGMYVYYSPTHWTRSLPSQKSAPVFKATQQAESDPSVTPDCAGADTSLALTSQTRGTP